MMVHGRTMFQVHSAASRAGAASWAKVHQVHAGRTVVLLEGHGMGGWVRGWLPIIEVKHG